MPKGSRAPVRLRGDVKIDSKRYVLYDSPVAEFYGRPHGGHFWKHDGGVNIQTPVPETISAVWNDFSGGMGETYRQGRETSGYAYAQDFDCSAGFIRLIGRPIVKLGTAASTNVPAFFFEKKSANGTLMRYCINGRYVFKLSVAANVITIEEEKDFGATASGGHPALFASNTYVPLGSAVNANYLGVPANSGVDGAAWTASDYKMLAAATIQDGNTAKFARAQGNQVTLASTPTLNANFAGGGVYGVGGFDVGDSSVVIASMEDSGTSLSITKQDGNLYRFDPTGAASRITAESPYITDTINGTGLVSIQGTDACIFNNRSGLHSFDGVSLPKDIGPDAIPTNRRTGLVDVSANVDPEPFRVTHYETAIYGRHVYILAATSTLYYILYGYMDAMGQVPRWHTYAFTATFLRGLFIDSTRKLWTVTNASARAYFLYVQLGNDGSPDPGAASIGYSPVPITGPAQFDTSRDDFGLPNVLKQLRDVEIEAVGLSSASPITVQVSLDGAAYVTLSGGDITADGVTKRYATTAQTFYRMSVRLILTPTGAYSSTGPTVDPRILSITVNAVTRPDKADLIRLIIDTTQPYGSGAKSIDSAKKQRDAIKALRNGAPVAYVDPDGNTGNLMIREVSDLVVRVEDETYKGGTTPSVDEPVNYLFEVEALVFVTA